MQKNIFPDKSGFALAALCIYCLLAFPLGVNAQDNTLQKDVVMTERQHTAQSIRQKFLGDMPPALEATDPEYAAMRDRLIYGEIAAQGVLTDEQRTLVTLVTLTAGQALGEITEATEAALRAEVAPVAIKEAVYQCAPYVGFPRVTAALRLVNAVFTKHNIVLPLEK